MSQELNKEAPRPTDPAAFFAIQGELPKLATPVNTASPLRKLGPSPFAKSGFPTLGFFESVYEHVENCAKSRAPTP